MRFEQVLNKMRPIYTEKEAEGHHSRPLLGIAELESPMCMLTIFYIPETQNKAWV